MSGINMDEQQNQLAFSFNENPVDNQVVDGGVLKSNAIPPFKENDESENETSPAPQATNTTQKKIMNFFDEGKPCGSNGCSVVAKTKVMPPPPPKDFLERPIPSKPIPPMEHLQSYFEQTVNKGGSKKSTPSPIATAQQQINQQQRQLIQQQRQLTQKLQATQQADVKRSIQRQQQQLAQQQQQLVHQQQQLTQQQQQAAQQASAKKFIKQQQQVSQQQKQVAQQQEQIAQQQKLLLRNLCTMLLHLF